MVNLDMAKLRPKLDLENKYVDFSFLRSALTVEKLVRDLEIKLSDPTKENECRAKCPKCEKDRSFCLNVSTNRFKCFGKGCDLKGGGVIDFFARINEVSAKESSHLLACAYGIAPYNSETPLAETQPVNQPNDENVAAESGEATAAAETVPDNPPAVPPLTPAHLIVSIEHQLAQLKKLMLASR
jgi:DNA primase